MRPGPRLNLANRRIGNHGPTTSTEASVHEDNATGEEESHKEEEAKVGTQIIDNLLWLQTVIFKPKL